MATQVASCRFEMVDKHDVVVLTCVTDLAVLFETHYRLLTFTIVVI